MHEPTEFAKALAMRLYAAYRSTFEARSFTEILADVHAGGWSCESERAAWEAVACLIVDHREEIDLSRYLDHQQSVN